MLGVVPRHRSLEFVSRVGMEFDDNRHYRLVRVVSAAKT
jgi:hypothetical protein